MQPDSMANFEISLITSYFYWLCRILLAILSQFNAVLCIRFSKTRNLASSTVVLVINLLTLLISSLSLEKKKLIKKFVPCYFLS